MTISPDTRYVRKIRYRYERTTTYFNVAFTCQGGLESRTGQHEGGGRTHAPVPFYMSSKGYGVFFNTARFIKVYSQIGNRKDSINKLVRRGTAVTQARTPGERVGTDIVGRP